MVRGKNEKESSSSVPRDEQLLTTAGSLVTTSLESSSSVVSLKQSAEHQEQNTACWDSLPSVILFEIFSYLPHKSRVQASQVCRQWRYALFHAMFWKKITFTLADSDSILWSRCLSDWFQFSVQEVTIRCETVNNFMREAFIILKKLSSNRQLRKLYLEPNSCMFENLNCEVNSKKLMKPLLNLIKTSESLEVISLGCIEELTEDLTLILNSLHQNHAKHLTHLSLASVKEDPDCYDFLELKCSLFNDFIRLSVLTIDYDHLSDELLLALNSGIMERLVIHVHGWNGDYTGASNDAWITFTQKNPCCQLRLNLIHSYNAVTVLDREILQPSMPLTHLKVLFCESVNNAALHQISDFYSETLQSIIWIDSLNFHKNTMNSLYDVDTLLNPDPLILAAWKCKNLNEIVFIGQKYFSNNLLAIIRLRHKLKRLEFAESDIIYEEPWLCRESVIDEIKKVMGEQWEPLRDEDLPKVVINPLIGDSREVIMPMVLRDQK
ncbi:F-box only protein 33 [Copidosoma floridanum]|uniref:F-box only protein 33 n=1 Tax=Copidosoma floridanum TaxID=29053 RepID=UPI0006C950B1|nr:F-box only protein 33 [Copidosoma floridanum]